MTFNTIRTIGVSLLTSAGIAGIILGFAAQKSISMIVAGIQIAITQPIKLNDLVVIDGESGRIEERQLTYVVVQEIVKANDDWDANTCSLEVNKLKENCIELRVLVSSENATKNARLQSAICNT